MPLGVVRSSGSATNLPIITAQFNILLFLRLFLYNERTKNTVGNSCYTLKLSRELRSALKVVENVVAPLPRR